MATDRMYSLAFRFRNAKLWEILNDTEMFAVRLPGDEIGYCCVMGNIESHFALAVYVGTEGYQSYRVMFDAETDRVDTMMICSMMAVQSCLQCSFESKEYITDEECAEVRKYAKARKKPLRGKTAYPVFKKHVPGRIPWRMESAEDEERICESLLAGIELSRMLSEHSKEEIGLQSLQQDSEAIPMLVREGDVWSVQTTQLPPAKIQYAEVEFADQPLSARLKKKEKKGAWECAACWMMSPIQEDETGKKAPYYPLALMAVDLETGRVIQPVITDGEDPSAMVHQFAERIQESESVPETLQCGDDRSFAMLRDLCEKTGICIEKTDKPERLEDAFRSLMDHMNGLDDDSDDGNDDPDDEEFDVSESIEDLVNGLSLMTDAQLKTAPPEVREFLLALADMNMLPNTIEKRIRKVFRK